MFELKIAGKAFVNGRFAECEIGVSDGKIAAVGKRVGSAARVLRAKAQQFILPGFIDSHVHFREPGQAHKEDWRTGSAAAAAGGITFVLDMPNDKPATDTPERCHEKEKTAFEKSIVGFGICGAVHDGNLGRLAALAPHIAAYGEIFLADEPLLSWQKLAAAYDEIASTGKVAITHAEDGALNALAKRTLKRYDHLLARPNVSEASAVRYAIDSAARTDVALHIAHVSTEEAASLVREAKGHGADVTCDATPHHLFLTEKDATTLGTLGKVNPPLRLEKDRNALWSALAAGAIDFVASDHAPHTLKEKGASLEDAPAGVPGIETLLPLMLTAVNKGMLSLERLAQMSAAAARRFSLNKGAIAAGRDADFTVVDLRKERRIDASKFHSKAKWSPFDGWRTKGAPIYTIVAGNIVME
jgi:dihydroorotase